jgi:hypothetical protein
MWQFFYEMWRWLLDIVQGFFIGFLVVVASFMFSVVVSELIGVEREDSHSRKNHNQKKNH